MDMTNEELAKVILGVRSGLGADRDDLMDESDERKWDALTEAAARLRQQSEDSARLDWVLATDARFTISLDGKMWWISYTNLNERSDRVTVGPYTCQRTAIDKARSNG